MSDPVKGTWAYRLCRKVEVSPILGLKPETIHAIFEVHFEDDEPVAVTTNPSWPQGESRQEFYEDWERYNRACLAKLSEVLDWNEIAAEGSEE